MLPKLGRPFRMKERNGKLRETDNNPRNSKAVGLGILVHRSPQPNLLLKHSTKLASSTQIISNNSCFLKTCLLCHKNLDPHEDIYMYRGDQGYCSIKCRNQQIENDERRELEDSTRKILESFRQCHKNEPIETHLLLEDLQRQHNRLPVS
ncbi:Protein MARD1 [Cucurbita argyrosperma subsp. argyrosperma]|uniref:Uncharacterized protein LOC111464182 n=2 Tax=Cucurbita TaxID=3660 RepID=A0A6J1HGR2_CUCMO